MPNKKQTVEVKPDERQVMVTPGEVGIMRVTPDLENPGYSKLKTENVTNQIIGATFEELLKTNLEFRELFKYYTGHSHQFKFDSNTVEVKIEYDEITTNYDDHYRFRNLKVVSTTGSAELLLALFNGLLGECELDLNIHRILDIVDDLEISELLEQTGCEMENGECIMDKNIKLKLQEISTEIEDIISKDDAKNELYNYIDSLDEGITVHRFIEDDSHFVTNCSIATITKIVTNAIIEDKINGEVYDLVFAILDGTPMDLVLAAGTVNKPEVILVVPESELILTGEDFAKDKSPEYLLEGTLEDLLKTLLVISRQQSCIHMVLGIIVKAIDDLKNNKKIEEQGEE